MVAIGGCQLAGPPAGWFERVCEAARTLAEQVDIEDPGDTAVRNAVMADRVLGMLAGLPPWPDGAPVVAHLVDAARGLTVAADGWTGRRFDVHSEGIGAYLTGIWEAEPALEALAAEHGRPCPIDGRYPKFEVPG